MAYDSFELKKLLDALLDETITAEQHARLQEILRTGEQARREYFSYIDIHLGIYDLEGELEEDLLPSLCCSPIPEPAPQRSASKLPWVLASISAIAAIVAISILTFQRSDVRNASDPQLIAHKNTEPQEEELPSEEATSPAAILTKSSNAELLLEYVPAIGAPLRVNHEYVLLNGMLELTFQNGATATLNAPSVFTIESGERMEMKMGNCSVYAPDGADGFQVITPESRIVDLGTRFTVVTNDTGTSDVQVIEGAIEIHPQDELGQMSLLLEGEAVRLGSSWPSPQPIHFDLSRYTNQFPDRVISYEAAEEIPGEGVEDLTSITVQRGGKTITYQADELIGIEVIHFSAYSISNNAACRGPIPEKITSFLEDDLALTSGLPNFDREPGPYHPAEDFEKYHQRHGMAIRFRQPVVNGPGPDLVLFDVQSSAYPATGDAFYVSPIENGPGLKTHFVKRFDVALNTTNALKVASMKSIAFEKPIRSVEDFSQTNIQHARNLSLPFHALAVGIDLSNLGYPAGARVNGLFFEDADDDEHVVMDPVFIGGFPEVAN